jgi:hypothetical protein
VKCAGDNQTRHCPRKESSNDVRCVLCDGNHPANYKGCTAYKALQRKTYPPLRPKHYAPLILFAQPSLPNLASRMPKSPNVMLQPPLPWNRTLAPLHSPNHQLIPRTSNTSSKPFLNN